MMNKAELQQEIDKLRADQDRIVADYEAGLMTEEDRDRYLGPKQAFIMHAIREMEALKG